MNYDVIIIGAGPGGIFAAYELMKEMPDCKVAVFEEGPPSLSLLDMFDFLFSHFNVFHDSGPL